jgi:hypothetical protein
VNLGEERKAVVEPFRAQVHRHGASDDAHVARRGSIPGVPSHGTHLHSPIGLPQARHQHHAAKSTLIERHNASAKTERVTGFACRTQRQLLLLVAVKPECAVVVL